MNNIPSKPTLQPLTPPEPILEHIDLPDTRLHTVTSGSGPPLIIIPATVSLISQWLPLAQFMGLKFTTHFFELPGHGGSSPYPVKFNSHLVPKTVAALADRLGYTTFNLMGFSFGGLLAMRTLEQLESRVDNVILLSPMLNRRALKYSHNRKWLLQQVVNVLKKPRAQQTAAQIMQTRKLQRPLIQALSYIGNVDRRILASKDALNIPVSTLDVLSHTLDEIFNTEFQAHQPFSTPCFFGMSVNDDLIDYCLTEQIILANFNQVKIQKFYYPYHQPPDPPTFQWLVDGFYPFLEMIDI